MKLVEEDLLPWKLVGASMEMLPLLPSIGVSTNIFRPPIAASTDISRRSSHELLYTLTYFLLLPRASQTSGCFHKINSNLNPETNLELQYLHGS